MEHPFDTLAERGFIQDVTDADGLREALSAGPVTFYYGADPTAPSLHIGNLIGLMAMAWLQRAGHRPIALVGGGTGRIGDPSGRDEERELLTDEEIRFRVERLRDQMSRVIDLDDSGVLIDNDAWLRDLELVDFLRDVGKHFSVNQMIARESVRRRLEQREHGISFTEFSYQLLQAYDFAHLYESEGCRLQIGGSDQWGNIVAGVELTRRLHGAAVFGLVWPLIERSDGKKFSKSTGEALWLGADDTSPYEYYQWFLNVPDADVGRFLRLYTFLPLEEIVALEEVTAGDPGSRAAQRTLADEATRIMHGEPGLTEAQRATEALFGDRSLADLNFRTLEGAFEGAPSADLPASRLDDGLGLLEAMVSAGAAASNGEARRLVEQGGVRMNNMVVDDPARTLTTDDLIGDGMIVFRVGKKRYFLMRFV